MESDAREPLPPPVPSCSVAPLAINTGPLAVLSELRVTDPCCTVRVPSPDNNVDKVVALLRLKTRALSLTISVAAMDPVVPPLPSCSVPELMVVMPVQVLALVRMTVPEPRMVTPRPVPPSLKTPERVSVLGAVAAMPAVELRMMPPDTVLLPPELMSAPEPSVPVPSIWIWLAIVMPPADPSSQSVAPSATRMGTVEAALAAVSTTVPELTMVLDP